MKVYDLKIAKEKIQLFCAYQDRCHQEVVKKLQSWGLIPDAVDMLLSELIKQNFLNEERYARSFARGKFRIKKWGRLKIIQELRKKGVYSKCIDFALKEIDEQDYINTLKEVLQKKSFFEKELNPYQRKVKLTKYLASKGYEYDLIRMIIDENS